MAFFNRAKLLNIKNIIDTYILTLLNVQMQANNIDRADHGVYDYITEHDNYMLFSNTFVAL